MVSKSERRRRVARERWERQQQRREQRAARVRRRRKVLAVGTAAAVLVAALVAGVWWWQSGDDDFTALTEDTPTAEPSAEEDVPFDGTCDWTETGESAVEGVGLPPAEAVDPDSARRAQVTLDGSTVTVDLLPDEAPCTVSSLAHLAGSDYFDGTTCHRLTSGSGLSVLQCGDPTGSGQGGPGYQFTDENLTGATYPAGTVAMANAGAGTNGSQFFLVYEDSQLPPSYTVFGTVTEGLDVVAGIAQRGTVDGGPDGEPAEPVTIDDLVVTGA